MNKRLALIGFLSLAFCGSVQAGAVIGATEPTQILNNLQLAASYAEQAQQTATQINQYRAMLQNLQQITPSNMLDIAAQKMWVDQGMVNAFRNLQTVVVDGQRIAYTMQNASQQFQRLNPGYGNYGGAINIAKSLKNWSDNTLNAVQNSISLLSAHADNFSTEQGMMAELQRRSRTAQGQLEATQAGSDIGIAMVGQMQQLRQIQMAQAATQNAYIAGQQSKNDRTDQAYQQFFNRSTTRVRTIQEIDAAGGK